MALNFMPGLFYYSKIDKNSYLSQYRHSESFIIDQGHNKIDLNIYIYLDSIIIIKKADV